MSVYSFSLFLCLSLFNFLCCVHSDPLPLPNLPSSPYFSPTIISSNYQNMLRNLKIFIYIPQTAFAFTSPAETRFYKSLLNSPFVTQNGDEAHLFFIPFPPDISTRSLARLIRTLRSDLPYWNRTLGADHFFLSRAGIESMSDRNIVELKKNSVQISCFPVPDGKFVPHKDITLPPLITTQSLHMPANVQAGRLLGYAKHGWVKQSKLVKQLGEDKRFLVESKESDEMTFFERLAGSEFCLFEYGGGDISGIGEALNFGCVPVVMTDRPIQDLPFMDVLRWQDMAVIVGGKRRVEEVKRVLSKIGRDRMERMKELVVAAGKHFVWNESQPFDSFNTLMYQLWLRRHTIRYVKRE